MAIKKAKQIASETLVQQTQTAHAHSGAQARSKTSQLVSETAKADEDAKDELKL